MLLKNIICDHIGLGCSGGLQALRNAYNQAIVDYTAGKIGYYLVIMGDQTSRLLDQNDFSTSFLFSEGAAAILLTNDQNEGRGYKIEKIGTKSLLGESIYDLRIKNPYDSLNKLGMIPKLKMNGLRVFQFAINIFPDILDLIGLKSMDKYTYFIPHQANLRIIKGIIKNNPNQLNPSNVYSDGIKNGNTSSASVFFGLNDSLKRGLFNQGYSVILGTFGAELQIGAALLLPQKEDLYVL